MRGLEKNLNSSGSMLGSAKGFRRAACSCFTAGSSFSVLVRSGGSDLYSRTNALRSLR